MRSLAQNYCTCSDLEQAQACSQGVGQKDEAARWGAVGWGGGAGIGATLMEATVQHERQEERLEERLQVQQVRPGPPEPGHTVGHLV